MDIANTTDTKKARGRKGPLAQNVYKLNLLSNFHFKSKKKAYNLGAPTQARVPFARVPSCTKCSDSIKGSKLLFDLEI